MESHTWRKKYKDGDSFALFLASDLHIDDRLFDAALFAEDMARAVDAGARLSLNGDVFGFILPGDMKRYTRGNDPGDVDDKIGAAVEQAEKVLLPYVDMLDMIGCGNHETSVLKYHSVDATKMLIGFLNRSRSKDLPPIRHGGYTGFCRYVFAEDDGGHAHAYTIYYNHGQGGAADVTNGIIDLQRRGYIDADLVWMGHKHKCMSTMLPSTIGVDHMGKIFEAPKRGLMTGTYVKNVDETDAGASGYRLSFAEERMRTPQGQGGALLRLTVKRAGITARVET
jgi:hypothetical protein